MSCFIKLPDQLKKCKENKKKYFLSLSFINFNLYHTKTYTDLCGSKLILLI